MMIAKVTNIRDHINKIADKTKQSLIDISNLRDGLLEEEYKLRNLYLENQLVSGLYEAGFTSLGRPRSELDYYAARHFLDTKMSFWQRVKLSFTFIFFPSKLSFKKEGK